MKKLVKSSLLVIVFSLCFVFTGCGFIYNTLTHATNMQKQINLNGGGKVVLTPQKVGNDNISNAELDAIKIILDYRLTSIGVSKKEITIDEAGSITIDFALDQGIDLSSIESKIDLITKVGLLTAQEVDENDIDGNGEYIPTGKIVFDGVEIIDVNTLLGEDSSYNISIELNEAASHKFEEATQRLIGKPIGIFMDDQLITAPMIQAKISGGKLVISGNFSKEEASNLSTIIKSGHLPAKLFINSIESIGPIK